MVAKKVNMTFDGNIIFLCLPVLDSHFQEMIAPLNNNFKLV